jgi:hypothetical protein
MVYLKLLWDCCRGIATDVNMKYKQPALVHFINKIDESNIEYSIQLYFYINHLYDQLHTYGGEGVSRSRFPFQDQK